MRNKWITIGIVCIAACGICACLGISVGAFFTLRQSPQAAEDSNPDLIQSARPTFTPAPSVGKWLINKSKSSFDDSETVTLMLDADKSIKGWLDSYTPTLIVRCKERATEVYVVVGMQQATEKGNLDHTTVRVRFDNNTATTEQTSHSTDGKSLFFQHPFVMIDSLKKHSKLTFGFTPFNASPVETSFDLAGFSEAVKPLEKACAH